VPSADPATVNSFYLDKYEITVGRFRRFVDAGMGTQVSPPAAGAGVHPRIASSGWDATWNTSLAATTSALKAAMKCSPGSQTWTDTPGSNESRPINCLDWFTAFAFCAWDGGRLATEAEWIYAAAGGTDQRVYPWSNPPTSTTIDDSYAFYGCTGSCIPINVGAKSWKGDGRWGHSDLAGNLNEFVLDYYGKPYPNPCDNCAQLENIMGLRSIMGGSFTFSGGALMTYLRDNYYVDEHDDTVGARCARDN
jgi:formylglycine-generating enzyme required for sulfatase activity